MVFDWSLLVFEGSKSGVDGIQRAGEITEKTKDLAESKGDGYQAVLPIGGALMGAKSKRSADYRTQSTLVRITQ